MKQDEHEKLLNKVGDAMTDLILDMAHEASKSDYQERVKKSHDMLLKNCMIEEAYNAYKTAENQK
jgi:phosphoribosylformylglycinamidine (FGAM) synthase PurS component